MGNIVKVAVLPIKNKKILLCRKKGIDFLIELGGKLESSETDEECAIRETLEEARCSVRNLEYFTTLIGPRGDEPDSRIELRCYFGTLEGEPKVNRKDKVYDFVYADRNWKQEGHLLPPILQELIGLLVGKNYL